MVAALVGEKALRWGPVAVVAAAALAFVAVELYLLRDVGPSNDEWTFLLYRPLTFHGLFDEYNAQPIVSEVLLYDVWARLAGPDHRMPLVALYAAMHAAVGSLVFAIARRRVGAWAAAGAAVLVLFLGRAWETLLTPAALTFMLPTLAACLAWFALDSPGRRGREAGAAGALALAGLCGGLVPAVLAGLAAELGLARRWRTLWIVLAGAVPLAGWYAVKLTTTPRPVGSGVGDVRLGDNLAELPVWAAKFLAAAAGAAVGVGPLLGAAVLVLGGIGLVLIRRVARNDEMPDATGHTSGGRTPWMTPRAAGLAVTLAATVLATGLARASTTPPGTSRYLYFPAVVLVLLACELWRAPVPRRLAPVAVVAVALAALLGLGELRDGKPFYRRAADGTAARMGAVRELGGRLPAGVSIVEPSRLAYTRADVERFARRHGDGAMLRGGELVHALPESRDAVDLLVAPVLVRPLASAARNCVRARGQTVPAWRPAVAVSAPAPVVVRLRALAEAPGAVTLSLPAGETLALHTSRLRPGLPWRLFAPGASVRACES